MFPKQQKSPELFSIRDWMNFKKEEFSIGCCMKEYDDTISFYQKAINDYIQFLKTHDIDKKDKQEIIQKISISRNLLNSAQCNRMNLGNEIKKIKLYLSNFQGFVRFPNGRLQDFCIPHGMQLDTDGLVGKDIYEIVDPSDQIFFEQVVHENDTNVISEKPADVLTEKPDDALPEKTADVLTEKPADVLTEKPADVLTEKPADALPEKPADALPEKTFSDAVKKNIDIVPEKEKTKRSIDIRQLFDLPSSLEKPSSLEESRISFQNKKEEPLSKKNKKELHESFEKKVEKVVLNYIERGSKEDGCNISFELKKFINKDEFEIFLKASCYHTNERSFNFWKEIERLPPLISVKMKLNKELSKSGFYLLTRHDDPANTSLCPEKIAEHLGATKKNLGTL